MKRMLCILALVLMLIASAWNSSEARLNPYTYQPVERDTGDDHPWGGEQNVNPDPAPIRSSGGAQTFSITGSVQLDGFFYRLIMPFWLSYSTGPGTESITTTNPSTTESTVTAGEGHTGMSGNGTKTGN